MIAPRMRIADEILAQIEAAFAGRPVPRVRALHLPPLPWNGSKDGEFGAVELECAPRAGPSPGPPPEGVEELGNGPSFLDRGAIGLSYVLLGDTPAELERWRGPGEGSLAGVDALALARQWRDGQGAIRTVGYAALAALSRHLLDAAGVAPPSATDSIGGLDPQPGEHIGMVGYFPPLLKAITASGARLTVVELRADLAGSHPGFEVTLDPAALRACDKVLSTSTVLLNDTLDRILDNCERARELVLIGPGAGVLPDALFRRGVTRIGGSWVEDRTAFVAALTRGAPWGRTTRKFLWRRGDYPGLPARG
jgi:uncharacterized protein (DUF4213/DUF364 family)